MRTAETYAEWKDAAIEHDLVSGKAAWREVEESHRYDFRTIRFRLTELREIRASGDQRRLLFYVKEGLHGNMGGMGSTSLYTYAKFGTKDLVTEFLQELADSIEEIALADETQVPLAEKLELFDRTSQCFGRTALMFSGAGSLGPFHLGVARALFEQQLLPSVLSGASAGAVVAAVLGTRSDDELRRDFSSSDGASIFGLDETLREPGQRIRTEDLQAMVAELVPDVTFEEALEMSGRRINISVSPRELHQRSRLLNAVTSPNVCVREAVVASCAIPGIFPAVTLAAKDVDGQRQPYIRSRRWVDGSATDDQPADRLSRLYGVNHFIASQANPIVLWTMTDSAWRDSEFGRLLDAYQAASREWFRATYPLAVKVTRNCYPANLLTRFAYGVATQSYAADINILPRQKWWDPRKLLAILTEEETAALVREGERSTWPKLEMIRNCSLVSRTLDRVADDLRAR